METQEDILKVRKALQEGNLINVDFYKDGSGAAFYFYYYNERYCEIQNQEISFGIEEAMQIISGFRFIQHKLINC